MGSLRDWEVAYSASDRQGSNFESCVWRVLSSHHPQEVILAQFSLCVHKGDLIPIDFIYNFASDAIRDGASSLWHVTSTSVFSFSLSATSWTSWIHVCIFNLHYATTYNYQHSYSRPTRHIFIYKHSTVRHTYLRYQLLLRKYIYLGPNTPINITGSIAHWHRLRLTVCIFYSISTIWCSFIFFVACVTDWSKCLALMYVQKYCFCMGLWPG